jgi:hypothetical protein
VIQRRQRRADANIQPENSSFGCSSGNSSMISMKTELSGVSSGGRLSQWRGVIFRLPKVIVVPTGTSTRDTRAEILSSVSKITVSAGSAQQAALTATGEPDCTVRPRRFISAAGLG